MVKGGGDYSMDHCNNKRKVIELKGAGKCRNLIPCWPTIKIHSTCIGVPPIVPPTPPPQITIIPTVKRYFYIAESTVSITGGFTIPATKFFNDDGSPTTDFMSFDPNGYANLYVNAVIQEGGMYVVQSNSLVIQPANSTIYRGTPIIIEILIFTAN